MPEERIMTKKELAAFMRVTPRTIENYMRRGLPHYKLTARQTRFRLADVLAWMEKSKTVKVM